MIRTIEGMPPGTIGVEAVGKVTEDDYRDVLGPALKDAMASGDVRLMYILGKDFDSYALSGMWADTKLWAGHLRSWKRVAIVTDADWIENSIKAFGWMMPGRVKVFETDDVDDAKEWLVDEDDDDDDDEDQDEDQDDDEDDD